MYIFPIEMTFWRLHWLKQNTVSSKNPTSVRTYFLVCSYLNLHLKEKFFTLQVNCWIRVLKQLHLLVFSYFVFFHTWIRKTFCTYILFFFFFFSFPTASQQSIEWTSFLTLAKCFLNSIRNNSNVFEKTCVNLRHSAASCLVFILYLKG